MSNILFVGDKPSNSNLNLKVPFVGTRSYKTLLSWIADMELDITHIALANQDYLVVNELGCILYHNSTVGKKRRTKVVTLGSAAAKKAQDLGLQSFALPHPSGLNRKLNDKQRLSEELERCKTWLKG